jgi:dolichyl-phosphate-mannose-protein mannosyltransferase
MKSKFIKFFDRRWHLILWGIFAAVLVSFLHYFLYRGFGHDEIEHLHTAWKISQGSQIYIDFFQHHHPFLSYLLVPILHIFGETTNAMFASRYLMLVFLAGILTLTYLLSLRLFKSTEIGIISLILTLTTVSFFKSSMQIRPDVPQVFFGLFSIYLIFVFYDKRTLFSLVASAVCLAVSFLFFQKSVFLVFIIGVVFLYDLYKRQVRFREIFIYFAVFLICISPYYIYLLLSGAFEQYIITNWMVNIYFAKEVSVEPLLMASIYQNLITILLYITGVFMMMKAHVQRRFAALSLGLLIMIFIFLMPANRNLIMLAPLIAIIAGYGLHKIFNKNWVKIIVLILAISIPMQILHKGGIFRVNNKKQSRQIDKINYVLSITDENDKVYEGKLFFNLYRDDIDYFWFCFNKDTCLDAYKKLTGYEYDIYDLIAKKKPKVITIYHINDLEHENIRNYYEKSDRYDDILIRKD